MSIGCGAGSAGDKYSGKPLTDIFNSNRCGTPPSHEKLTQYLIPLFGVNRKPIFPTDDPGFATNELPPNGAAFVYSISG
jgi:hypothetical protein